MVDIVKERVFNTLFDSMKEKVKGIKEKNEIKTLTLKYFNDYFKDIDFTEEFDYESVTEYLLEMYESIYKSATPQDTIDGIISGCVARGNGNNTQIKRYCNTVLSFWDSIIQRNIPREEWYLMNELNKHFDKKMKKLYENIKELLEVSDNNIYSSNDLYADSFCETLFLHRDKKESKVKLSNLFVIQKYVELSTEGISLPQNNLIDRIKQFIFDDQKQLLLIEGDAGSGKSSLVGYLNYHYRIKDQATFENRSLVTIRLRDLDRNMISKTAALRMLY